MTLTRKEPHLEKRSRIRHHFDDSPVGEFHIYVRPQEAHYGPGYSLEDELYDQFDKLPTPEHVEELCSALRVATLRELSAEIINGGIKHAKGNADRLVYAKLLNSWIATAEETVAAGKNVNTIAARRKRKL